MSIGIAVSLDEEYAPATPADRRHGLFFAAGRKALAAALSARQALAI
jgi:hypothetical protein